MSPESVNPLAPILARQGVVVLDGGLATSLEAAGHDLDDPLWSARVLLEEPEAVGTVHRAYLEAGADCIATATYQATFRGFAARGLGDAEAEAALRAGVDLAVAARDAFWADPTHRVGRQKPQVAASVGPYGAYLADGSEYTGHYDLDEEGLVTFHRRRWQVLSDTPADLLACETIPSLAEARALVRLLAGTPGRWAWISFQCRDEHHLADGSRLADAVAVADGCARVAAVGVNCVPPGRVAALLAEVREATAKPLLAYPNSGERWDGAAKVWRATGEGPDGTSGADPDLAAFASAWLAAGATVLGGCCRTGPGTIRALRRALLPGEPLTPS